MRYCTTKIKARNRKVIKDIKTGCVPSAVAAKYSLTQQQVWNICNIAGVSLQQMRFLRREKMAKYIEKGKSLEQAVNHFKVGSQTIQNACRENNVIWAKKLNNKNKGTLVILKYLLDAPMGSTLQSIANKTKVSRQRISQVWLEARVAGFFDDLIWTSVTGKSPKPSHMKNNTKNTKKRKLNSA